MESVECVTFTVHFTDEEAMREIKLPLDLLDEMSEMIGRTREAARPKAIFGRQSVEVLDERHVRIGEVVTESRIMAVNLEKCDFGVTYVCTCGRELNDIARAMPDPMEGFLQDALNEMVLRKAIEQLRELVQEKFGLYPIHAMAPGSLADWPLPRQADLFSTLEDVTGRIGVELNDSYLMLPIKSVSGIFFTLEEEYVNCMLCPRETCQNRRAPYDLALLEGKYKGAETKFFT